jgi:Holliday junction DNA helicase RuvA
LDELKAFQLLIGVSGVGPKVALAILSVMSPDRFALALTSGDTDAFSHVPGVGKKTAARIILDLKGKFEQDVTPVRSIHEDVKLALMGLGYSASEAATAAAGIPDSADLTLEEKVRLALRHFARTA